MKTQDAKWELFQHRFQHRYQPPFADLLLHPYHLPLCYLIYCIEVIYPFASVGVSLMDRIHAEESWPALRVWLPPFPMLIAVGRSLIDHPPFSIGPLLAYIVEVPHRESP